MKNVECVIEWLPVEAHIQKKMEKSSMHLCHARFVDAITLYSIKLYAIDDVTPLLSATKVRLEFLDDRVEKKLKQRMKIWIFNGPYIAIALCTPTE